MPYDQLLYLSRRAVEDLGVGMPAIIDAVEAAFIDKGAGRVEMPPKPGIHTRPNAFIHAMPAYLRSSEAAGMKWISGYPANQDMGLPYISGLFILNDAATGFPLAVMDATWITAMRTGAATAVAAKYLARPDSKTLAILGCGVQGRSNTLAVKHVLPRLERVLAYDIRPEVAEDFRKECVAKHGLPCEVCAKPEIAVRAADVIVTAGPILLHPSPVIVPEWLREGSFVCPLDFDSYLTPAAFAAADFLSTDDLQQYLYYQHTGYFAGCPSNPVDLGEVVSAGVLRRKREADRIVSVNLGLALEDVATAKLLYDRAVSLGAGLRLEL